MKATILMKIAVVFMAAFGAYAFSGNAQPIPFKEFNLKEGQECINIEARCAAEGNYDCKILIGNTPMILFDLDCDLSVKHTSSDSVEWN